MKIIKIYSQLLNIWQQEIIDSQFVKTQKKEEFILFGSEWKKDLQPLKRNSALIKQKKFFLKTIKNFKKIFIEN